MNVLSIFHPVPLRSTVAGLLFSLAPIAIAGSLTPLGPPGPTMKPLDQVEPRTAILSIPTTITVSGSYYLVGNHSGVAGADGIVIAADNVMIDMQGFALVGVPGARNAITVDGTRRNLAVSNGSFSDWPLAAVRTGSSSNNLIHNVRISGCGAAPDGALQVALNSVVRDCVEAIS